MKKIFFIIYFMHIVLSFGEESKGKIGLVLSGGGAKGFAHIGLLKVLDEEKVPVDYIAGTSMGSIIGALYAMGYSGEEIEKIILSRDWLSYFNDTIKREEELIENKNDKDKYAFSFPIENWRVKLPKGVVKGQSIDSVLSELYLDAKDINDFSKLPIPFSCVATDVETGKEIILNKGYLPEAIRASMSLPSLFSPVEIDDKLLIDGGVVDNFPANIALNMGADYLIGVDIGSRLKKKEEIGSFIDILNQTSNYKKVEATEEARKKVNLLLLPNMNKYELLSFDKAKDIIAEGEKAAREQIDEIRKLRNEEKFNEIKSKKIENIEKFTIENININGNENFDDETIKKIINIELPAKLSREDLSKLMEKMYNLRFFGKVDYKILGNELVINVKEIADKELKMGFNYNDFSKGEFYIKGVGKGLGYFGNKTSAEVLIGKDESFKLQNTWYIGPINKFGYSISAEYSNLENVGIFIDEERRLEYNVDLLNMDFMLGNFLSNSQMIGMGIKREYFSAKQSIISDLNVEKHKEKYNLIYLKYLYDSLDNKYFPKKGNYVNAEIQYSDKNLGDLDFIKYGLKFNKPFKINNKLSLNFGGEATTTEGDNYALYYVPRLGGFYNRQNSIPFWGIETSSQISERISMGYVELFYEVKPMIYLILRYNEAFLKENGVYNKDFLRGGGIGVGVKSPLGPIQFILATGSNEDVISYLNIGYNF